MEDVSTKVIIYSRVSTEEQMDKGYSIDGQIYDCKKRAFELGYKESNITVISDGISGGLLDRPGLNKLRELISSDIKPEIIIMYDPDRFARKLTHQLVVTDEILKNGIQLEFINFEWKNTPEGRMYYQLRGIFAEFEREKIRERTIRGRMTKLKKHGKLSYDPRLYGYKFDTVEDVLILHPEESKVVQLIFMWAAEGNSGEAIARKLANDNISAPRGSKWYGATVTRILNNESYLGTYWAYKSDYHQGFKRKRPREEQFPISIEPIITKSIYDKAQKVLQGHRTRTGRPAEREYLASGLGRCFCGRSVVASVKSGNREYTYYSCVGKHKTSYDSMTGKSMKTCDSRYWNSTVVDEVVWEKVKEIISNPKEILEEFIEENIKNKEVSQKLDNELLILTEQQKRLQHKKNKLLDLYLSEGIERSLYDIKMKDFEKDFNQVVERIQDIQNEQRTFDTSSEEILNQVSYLNEYQKSLGKADFKKKKQIVNVLIDKIVFNKDRELSIVFNIGQPYP